LPAALVTRFVLPALLPQDFAIRDVNAFRRSHRRPALQGVRRIGRAAIVLWSGSAGDAGDAVLYHDRATLWNRELSALSPVPIEEQGL